MAFGFLLFLVRWLKENFWYIPLSGFLLIGGLAAYSWYLGYVDFGITLQGTFPLFPYYSPHKYNIVMYSLFYVFFFNWRFPKNQAILYFFMAYCIQESIDNIFTSIPQLLTGSNIDYGFLSSPPYNGGILWIAIIIFLVVGFGLFFYLRPEIKLNSYWRIALMSFWLWIDRGYINVFSTSLANTSFPYLLEIVRNGSYMFLMVAILYPRRK